MAAKMHTNDNNNTTVYDKHTKDAKDDKRDEGATMGWLARILIFLGFPVCVGFIGLYLAYLESLKKPERKIIFDTDFVIPFLLALSMAMVVGFQTRGYTSNKVEPLIKWPKVRTKKVIKKVKRPEIGEGDKDETDKKDD